MLVLHEHFKEINYNCMARKEAFSNNKKGISGNHHARKGKTLIYLVILVFVVIVMVGLGKFAKRPTGGNIMDGNSISQQSNEISFLKEGELELFNQEDELIIKIDIEIADDDIQTTNGLMHRKSMEENQGMLFIFAEPEIRSFWMKNTYIALDLIFLDQNRRIVHIHEGAQPKSQASIPSIKPAQYVLEVNEGFSARKFLKVGDWMNFKRTY